MYNAPPLCGLSPLRKACPVRGRVTRRLKFAADLVETILCIAQVPLKTPSKQQGTCFKAMALSHKDPWGASSRRHYCADNGGTDLEPRYLGLKAVCPLLCGTQAALKLPFLASCTRAIRLPLALQLL